MFSTFFSAYSKFINFDVIRPILDILVLSLMFYFIYLVFRTLESRFLVNLILITMLVYVLAVFLRLDTVLWIFRSVFEWVIIGAIIVFQPELRILVSRMRKFFEFKIMKNADMDLPDFKQISDALHYLVDVKRGALLVFPRKMSIEGLISGATEMNANLHANIVETIFAYDTPLHDGAVVINNNRIHLAGCYLPMEKDLRIPLELGSRHRAAISLTHNSDAVVIIVSEENKTVSIACETKLFYDVGITRACDYVSKWLQNEETRIFWNRLGVERNSESDRWGGKR